MANSALKDKAAKGFLWGALSNGSTQLLSALFGLVLLRLLSPQDYGRMTMLLVFANLANALQESGFIAALCNLPKPTHRDYNAVFWFNVGVGFLLYVLLFFLSPWIADFYGDPSLKPLARFLFLGFFISSTGTVQRAQLFIHLRNKEQCIIAVTAVIISGAVGVTMAWRGFGAWGLATQHIVFITVVAVMNWMYSPWRPSWRRIDMRPAWRMFSFSSRLLLTYIVNLLSNNIFGLLLGKYYGQYRTGIYGTARKWTDMGSNTINGMLTTVAQPVLSRVNDDTARYKNVFRKMLRFVSFVSFPTMLGLGLVSEEFLRVLAGVKWIESAPLMRLLCFYGAIFPLLTLYGQLTISRGHSKINMWCTVSLSTLILTGLIMLRSYGIETMVIYFVTINALWLLVWQYWTRKLVRLSYLEAALDTLPFALVSLAVMLFTGWATQGMEARLGRLLLRIVMAATLYLGLIWLSGAKILRESLVFIRQRFRYPSPPAS